MDFGVAQRRHVGEKILIPKLLGNFLIYAHEIVGRGREVGAPTRLLRDRFQRVSGALKIGLRPRSLDGARGTAIRRSVHLLSLFFFAPQGSLPRCL
jgi:hypothetical protein